MEAFVVHCDVLFTSVVLLVLVFFIDANKVGDMLYLCEYVIYQIPGSEDPPPCRRSRPHEAAAAGASISESEEIVPAE